MRLMNPLLATRKKAIYRTVKFDKKELCSHSLDIGLICDHGCLYCSTPTIASARTNPVFKENGTTAQKAHNAQLACIDLGTPERVAADAKQLTASDVVMMCTKVDPFSPAVQQTNLFRDCLYELLTNNPHCQVRVLSKNAGIVDVLKDFTEYADRIHFSLSLTAPTSQQDFIDIVEPNTSSITERIDALKEAHGLGFRMYGMVCPCIPGILTEYHQVESVFKEVLQFNPETIWVEPVNSRGQGFNNMVAALDEAGKHEWASSIKAIKNKDSHDEYVAGLINTVALVSKNLALDVPIRFLSYNRKDAISAKLIDDSHVIWL
ncbi:hypothetical protein SAMN02745704_00093 [Paucidesulfovibrio gracilis DSM 16080]|uniref:DNA repair photolyase n=1 Tax=Paucidesulfovibrio gracilis DSM 16080 TaxID=1121449 RepID=A0A1T4W2A8_9BACT|nr:hypothetical protein [Paucidesulfovibrio gracilis]SKA71195.1 hypothetical protein SAMN02745704_00093 [Paucidesulfovibrio gracilis DSM 16080]